jgi:UDP-N-acetylmuramoyl-L-alanyl-D-glutamate--2,6-diaminopimelate ligase
MRLDDLSAKVAGARVATPTRVEVRGISHDSREVKPGDLFVCLVGERHDGHLFAADALARGAAALVVQESHSGGVPRNAPKLVVADTRRALPALAAEIYGHPSRNLRIIGITGTNGKTTTTQLIASILRAAGFLTGTIGTLGTELMGEPLPSQHTTPEADQLQAIFAQMRARGAQALAMEVSSHALAQYRTDCTAFDAAVFTNLTQDHLDYHGTLEDYFQAKLRLFREYPAACAKTFVASVNLDDPRGEIVARETAGRALTYAVQREEADIRAKGVQIEPGQTAFRVYTPAGEFEAELQIGGAFQVYNALAAVGVGIGLGIKPEIIARGLASLKSVPGRFEAVPANGRGFHVIVDYAHTPDGLENLLASARRLHPQRVIVVFGCGGNRDRTKRPMMGRLAATCAEIAIVTSDNPRHEEPQAIIDDILTGMSEGTARILVEPDRRKAIGMALREAREGDIVLIAGKGHEDYQIIGDMKMPFDDRQVVREWLMGELSVV